MKAILMSIQPKWCELIVSGKKTIEVRKTAPKDTPFKAYIYCTKDGYMYRCRFDENRLAIPEVWNGKVVGEFICDKVIKYDYQIIACAKYELNGGEVKEELKYNAGACLTAEEMYYYANGKDIKGLHISELKIYDEPKELGELRTIKYMNKNGSFSGCVIKPICIKYLSRPPQSWQYVEEL